MHTKFSVRNRIRNFSRSLSGSTVLLFRSYLMMAHKLLIFDCAHILNVNAFIGNVFNKNNVIHFIERLMVCLLSAPCAYNDMRIYNLFVRSKQYNNIY